MAKKDPPRDPNERTSLDPAKMHKEDREKIDNEFPRAIGMAMYAGCVEFDFLRATELLMKIQEKNLHGLPITPETLEAAENIGHAYTRLHEAMFHMSQFNKSMQKLSDMVEKFRSGGIQTATPEEAERLARGKLKT